VNIHIWQGSTATPDAGKMGSLGFISPLF